MFACVGGIGAVLVGDGLDGFFVEFVERRLVLRGLVEFRLQLECLVGIDRLFHVEVLHEVHLELLVLGESFDHLLRLSILFAGERCCKRVDEDFVVLAKVKSYSASTGCSNIADNLEGGECDLDQQVHDRLPYDFHIGKFRVLYITFHGNVELDFVILVLENVETDLHRDDVFRIGAAILVADIDVVDVDGVLAFDVPVAHCIFACECHCAGTDGVAGEVVAVRREMLECQVLHADVGVHGADVGERTLVLELHGSAFGECGGNIDGAGVVEVDVFTIDGDGTYLVVERLLGRVVSCGHGGVCHLQLVDDCLQRLGLFFFLRFRFFLCGFLGGLHQRLNQHVDVRLAVLEEFNVGGNTIYDDGVDAEIHGVQVRLVDAHADVRNVNRLAASFGELDFVDGGGSADV